MRRAVLLTLLGLGACTPDGIPAEVVVQDIRVYSGRTIDMRATLRSGARCRLSTEEWQPYCKDCQFCGGPLVVDVGTSTTALAKGDWPMILAGSYEHKAVRCEGPLNGVACYPFEPGKTYVIRGFVEQNTVPRFFVKRFWPVED